MINKVLLLEDRPSRSNQILTPDQRLKLDSFEFVNIPIEMECDNYIISINNGNCSELKSFSLLMIHRSALNHNGLRYIMDVCKTNKLDLVLFSGGISQNLYLNEGYQYLTIHSRYFYSDKLLIFLSKYSVNKYTSLLELAHGELWILEQLMRYRRLQIMLSSEADEYNKSLYEEKMLTIEKNISVDNTSIDDKINTYFNIL